MLRTTLIARGVLVPRAAVDRGATRQRWRDEPTLRLQPGERERFEKTARAGLGRGPD